jgi:hypothetical protein
VDIRPGADGLRTGELAQSVGTVDATESGFSDATERQRRDSREPENRVDGHHAGAQILGGLDRSGLVLREDRRAEPIVRPVGLLDAVFEVAHPVDREERTEGLFGHGGAVLGDIAQDDGVDVRLTQRLASTEQRVGTLVQCVLDLSAHDGVLPVERHRTVRGVLVAAHAQSRRLVGELADEGVVDLVGDVNPLDTGTGLPGVAHAAEHGEARRDVEVGVGRDEHRVLATPLGDERGECLGAGGHHLLGRGTGTGEGDLVDARFDERTAGRAVARDDLEHGLIGDECLPLVLEPHGDTRRQLTRLEDDGVACRERVGDGAHRREHRVVPGADDTDDAERLVVERGFLVRADQSRRNLLSAEHLPGVLGRPVEVLDGEHDLEDRVVDGLAGLGGHDTGQGLRVAGDRGLPLLEPLLAAVEAERRPPHRGLAGACHGGGHGVGVVDRVLREHTARPRVEGGEGGCGVGCLGSARLVVGPLGHGGFPPSVWRSSRVRPGTCRSSRIHALPARNHITYI